MRDAEYFWGIGYITVILFAIIQNGAFQHDFIDFLGFHSHGMFDFVNGWYIRLMIMGSIKNSLYGGEAWVIRILAIVAIIFILAIMIVMIIEAIKRYKKCGMKFHRCF